MKLHANARLGVNGRELLVDRILVVGWSRETTRNATRSRACTTTGRAERGAPPSALPT